MQNNDRNITNDNIKLLEYLSQQPNKVFTHKELIDKGFNLSESSFALINKLVRRDGYNSANYKYFILPNGIGYLENLHNSQELLAEDKIYRQQTIELAEKANEIALEANDIALKANKKSRNAIIISVISGLFTIGSFIVAIVALI